MPRQVLRHHALGHALGHGLDVGGRGHLLVVAHGVQRLGELGPVAVERDGLEHGLP